MKNLFVLILFAGLCSCTSYVELDQEEYDQKIVVDGWIESGGYANVLLTLSSPFLTSYDSASIRATFINYAKVTLTSSKGESEILTIFYQDDIFPPFVYRSTKIKGELGCTYDLKVEVLDKVVTASTSILEVPDITGLHMEAKTDSSGILKLDMNSKGIKDEFLIFMIKSTKAKDKNYHPTKVPICWAPKTAKPSSFDIYRCNETNMYMLYPEMDAYANWPDFQYALSDTIKLKVGRIDQKSYDVLLTVYVDLSLQENPFSFGSTGIKTNIVGGIGRWTGIALAPLQEYFGK
jgi:hypothetical protein